MLQEFKTTYISTATTTSIVAAGRNAKIHTIVVPKAATGTITVSDGTTTYFVLPIASIGTFILDAVFPNGITVVTSAGDTVLVTSATY